MRDKSGDKYRIHHILDAITEIETYLKNVEFPDFMKNSMMRFACIKQIEIIGEACNHISAETQKMFSSIEWGQIIGMRNIFVHEYFGIDTALVWEIIKNDLPELKIKISDIANKLE